jgi:glycosyltransferase involved in cell wall biosynthesis
MAEPLSWSLVVATYNRGHILRRCLELAVSQTRPPREVVIVDASTNWRETCEQILNEVAPRHPTVRWEYVEARVRSLTAQRNQALELATSDVLFLIDDDSFMYPDCAEEVMRVYEADRGEAVAGVGPMLADWHPEQTPPNGSASAPSAQGLVRRLRQRVTDFLEQQLHVEKMLLPYDRNYPCHPLSAELLALDVAEARYLQGCRMTYRRQPIQKERFDELLRRYAAIEDLDASYRVSRHGALVNAFRARLYHAQDPSSRLSRYTCALLGLMNLAMMYRLKGYDAKALLAGFRRRVLRRLGVDLLRDLSRGRFRLPCARADWKALGLMRSLLNREEAELRQWFPSFQNDLIDRNPT